MLSLLEICEATEGQLIRGSQDQQIDFFHFDTRQLKHGGMFIALTDGARDGHQFLEEAKKQGAACALISNQDYCKLAPELSYVVVKDTQKAFAQIAKWYRKKLAIPFIAVTGSNGKTTTKDMIAHVLGYKKKVFKTYKNYNNHLGVPLSILQIEPDHEAAVIEMGMNHPGEIDYLAGITKPDISVIINVTDAHIEFLGSKENIAKAKGELLPHTSKSGFAILNGDNPYVVPLETLNPGKTYFFRLDKKSDIYATDLRTTEQGTLFTVHSPIGQAECTIPMFGTHNVANALPAIFIALRFGYSLDDIKQALSTLSISPMRFELVKGPNQAVIINDAYNASPTSMKSSIQAFSEILPSRKKILVLGDMFELGTEKEAFHREVGQFLTGLAAQFESLVTVGDLSKFIAEGNSIPAHHFIDKEEAAKFLCQFLDSEHALLFKASRGMKLEEIIAAL
jgi:UDP-N-acetylmuramoyl-tripeptide--D-alanyl-D-alanine ligase